MTDRSEVGLLALMTIVVGVLAGWAIVRGSAGESAAWSAILMAIVNAVKERWQARTIDRQSAQLHASNPSKPEAAELIEGDQR